MDWPAVARGVASAAAADRAAAERAVAACDARDAARLAAAVATGRLEIDDEGGGRAQRLPLAAREAAAVLLVPVLLGDEAGVVGAGRLWEMDEADQDRICTDLVAAASATTLRAAPRLHARIAHAVAAMAHEYGGEWPAFKDAMIQRLRAPAGGQPGGIMLCLLVAEAAPEAFVATFSSDEEIIMLATALRRVMQVENAEPDALGQAVAATSAFAALGPHILGQDRHHFRSLSQPMIRVLKTCAQASAPSLAACLSAFTEVCFAGAYALRDELAEILHVLLTLVDAHTFPDETRVLALEALATLAESLPSPVRHLRDGSAVPPIVETLLRTCLGALPDDAPIDVLQDGGSSAPCAAASAAVIGRLATPACLQLDPVAGPTLKLAQQCMQVGSWKAVVAALEAVAQLVDAHCEPSAIFAECGDAAPPVDPTLANVLDTARDWIVTAVAQHADPRVHYSALACLGTLGSHSEALQSVNGFWRTVGQITAAGMASQDSDLRQCACQVLEVFVASHAHALHDLSGYEVVLKRLHDLVVPRAETTASVWLAALDAATALTEAPAAAAMVDASFADWRTTLGGLALGETSPCGPEDRLRAAVCLASFCKAVGPSTASQEIAGLARWARDAHAHIPAASPASADVLSLWSVLVSAAPAQVATHAEAIFDLAQRVLSFELERAQALEAQGLSAHAQTEASREGIAAWNLIAALARQPEASTFLMSQAERVYALAQTALELDLAPDMHVAAAEALSQLSARAPAQLPATEGLVKATFDLLLQAQAVASGDIDLQMALVEVIIGLLHDGPAPSPPLVAHLGDQLLQRLQESLQERAVLDGQARLYAEPDADDGVAPAERARGQEYRLGIVSALLVLARMAPPAYLELFQQSLCPAACDLANAHRILEDRLVGLSILAETPRAAHTEALTSVYAVAAANLASQQLCELRNDLREQTLIASCRALCRVMEARGRPDVVEIGADLASTASKLWSSCQARTKSHLTVLLMWSSSFTGEAAWLDALPLAHATPALFCGATKALVALVRCGKARALGPAQIARVAQALEDSLRGATSGGDRGHGDEDGDSLTAEAREVAVAVLRSLERRS